MNTHVSKEEYDIAVTNLTRNIELFQKDLENGVLTNKFFKRKDISEHKKAVLQDLNNRLIINEIK